MIPTIEEIVESLAAGLITKSQAVSWLHQHAENAYRMLRDDFAAAALQGFIAMPDQQGAMPFNWRRDKHGIAEACYGLADAMLAERSKP